VQAYLPCCVRGVQAYLSRCVRGVQAYLPRCVRGVQAYLSWCLRPGPPAPPWSWTARRRSTDRRPGRCLAACRWRWSGCSEMTAICPGRQRCHVVIQNHIHLKRLNHSNQNVDLHCVSKQIKHFSFLLVFVLSIESSLVFCCTFRWASPLFHFTAYPVCVCVTNKVLEFWILVLESRRRPTCRRAWTAPTWAARGSGCSACFWRGAARGGGCPCGSRWAAHHRCTLLPWTKRSACWTTFYRRRERSFGWTDGRQAAASHNRTGFIGQPRRMSHDKLSRLLRSGTRLRGHAAGAERLWRSVFPQTIRTVNSDLTSPLAHTHT